jgi:putative DNA primase/helicase
MAFITAQGTLQDWKEQVAPLCRGNCCLLFAVSTAFSSPLLTLMGFESGGVHLRGASSKGKSTVLFMACSVWGSKEYLQPWRTTINGAEALAACHNDALLCLDELSQVDPVAAGEMS